MQDGKVAASWEICFCHMHTTKGQINMCIRTVWSAFVIRCLNSMILYQTHVDMGRVKRICYLSPMRAAKVQASLRIRSVSPEPSLLAHTSSESRGTFRQKARSLAPLNGWACAVKICHDGMLEDTNSLDAAQIIVNQSNLIQTSSWRVFVLKDWDFFGVYMWKKKTKTKKQVA